MEPILREFGELLKERPDSEQPGQPELREFSEKEREKILALKDLFDVMDVRQSERPPIELILSGVDLSETFSLADLAKLQSVLEILVSDSRS